MEEFLKEPKERNRLKIGAVFMVIIGVIALLFSVFSIIGYNNLDAQTAADFEFLMNASINTMITLKVISAIIGIAEIIAGLFGAINAGKMEKMKFCVTLGFIVLALLIGGFIAEIVMTGFSVIALLLLAVECIVAGIYITGAKKNLLNNS